mmetsp:Transcript_19260/g.41866  ORF Transcript_19260/g.41866 Transcript_19260/m.41866 type:complete len:312 (-) Transcript_19260:121-1056(-)
MANPFINSSFTLRPSRNDRDIPELTLRQTEESRIPKDTTAGIKEGRAFKRQRLFMNRFISTTFPIGCRYNCYDGVYSNDDQYISDEEEYAEASIIRRRVSTEFPSRDRITRSHSSSSSCMGTNVSEADYWKTRCLGMQDMVDDSQARLGEAEEDQRQLRQRIRELEEQLLLQSSPGNANSSNINSCIGKEEGKVNNIDEAFKTRDKDTDSNIEGNNNKFALKCMGEDDAQRIEDVNRKNKKRSPPALVVEIKENHQVVSSCFYLTDGEGLNESYDQDMEEEDISMDAYYSDGMLDDIDDDRNDINLNQRRG